MVGVKAQLGNNQCCPRRRLRCRYLLGGVVLTLDCAFLSSGAGVNPRFISLYQAAAAPRRRDLLEDTVKSTRREPDGFEDAVGGEVQPVLVSA